MENNCYSPKKTDFIILISRIVENMSQLNLFCETFSRMPDAPNLNHTLLFIQTNKYFPMGSAVSLDQKIPEQYQDFLESQISLDFTLKKSHQETICSTSVIKKKKTGCTCKKTKCLKMYCECFSSGKMCTPDCSCYGCSNDHCHQVQIEKLKQSMKSKLTSYSKQNPGKGCNCKKSQCQKKYCQCFNAGLSCGNECKCEDCANGSCQKKQHGDSFEGVQSSKMKMQKNS